MDRFNEINKIVDEILDADTLFEFVEEVYDSNQKIANLQHKLKVAEIATKLACNELRNLNYKTFDNMSIDFEQQFKELAEEELKGEKNE